MSSIPVVSFPKFISANLPKAPGEAGKFIQITDIGGGAIYRSNGVEWVPVTYASFPAGLPTASVAYRGLRVFVPGAAGAADTLVCCMKSAADTYSWKNVATG